LIGRLPVVSALKPLDVGALMRVLTEPRNALVRQYQKLFEMEDAELAFTEGALRSIAMRAHEKETGARGLRSIIEEVMLDVMFELPEQGAGKHYVVTDDVVLGRQRLFPLTEPKNKSA
jgi:ATP-dependent Clp protease ATP-binding subunit ClpX